MADSRAAEEGRQCRDWERMRSKAKSNESNTLVAMDIFEATRRYEGWMGRHVQLISHQLLDKHATMKGDVFAFFRATYYR
jgi:hypothetical protein